MAQLPGFYFSVIFELIPQFKIDTQFQSVSGLKVTMGTDPISEGGQNRYKYNLPTKASYEKLILKRGMTKDLSGLKMWANSAIEDFVFAPSNLIVSLLNEKGNPTKVWYVAQAIPVGLSISDFNAEANSLVIETFTLDYQYFKELPIP